MTIIRSDQGYIERATTASEALERACNVLNSNCAKSFDYQPIIRIFPMNESHTSEYGEIMVILNDEMHAMKASVYSRSGTNVAC